MDQRKAFYRQRIPECSRAKKETVDIDIFVTSRNGDRKMEVEPVEPVLKNIHQSNNCRKDLSWQHFDDEVKDKQSCIFVFVACITIPSSN